MVGIGLCILAAAPLFICAAVDGDAETMFGVVGFCITLLIVAFGVHNIVLTCTIQGGYQRLLEEGDYSREKKLRNRKMAPIAIAYWCIVTAIYLLWSFLTWEWYRTWIIWPVAGVLYGAIDAVSNMVRK